MKLNSKSGATLAAAAATLFLAGSVTAFAQGAPGGAAEVQCTGLNACKGQSACKGGNHACKGLNACKGQGFVMAAKEQCKQAGGKVSG